VGLPLFLGGESGHVTGKNLLCVPVEPFLIRGAPFSIEVLAIPEQLQGRPEALI
jgi:hypothetical protein